MHDLKEKHVNSIRAWQVKYENLEQEKQRLYEEMVEELREWQHKGTALQQENAELRQCVRKYVSANGLSCQGSTIATIKTKSGKEKKIKKVKQRAQQALVFLELFGLSVAKLKVKDDKGVSYNLDMGLMLTFTRIATPTVWATILYPTTTKRRWKRFCSC